MASSQKSIEWAREAARRLIEEFSDAPSIDTADYQLCGFILAAAKVAMKDENLAGEVGSLMEPKRAMI